MYYGYLHALTGVSKSPSPNYFDIGSAVHVGLAESLKKRSEDAAAEAAVSYYVNCKSTPKRHPSEVLQSCLLIEALIRAWYVNGYEAFHGMYDVLYIEEEVYMLSRSALTPEIMLHWESRPDAIVREKRSPIVAGISWKTIDSATEYRRQFFRHDLQGLFEMWFGSMFLQRLGGFAAPRIDYIRTILLEKGRINAHFDFPTDNQGDHMEQVNDKPTDSILIQVYQTDPHGETSPFFNEIPGVVKDLAWKTRYWKPRNKSYNRLTMNRRLLTQVEIAPYIHGLGQGSIFPTPEYNNGESALDRTVIWEQEIMRSESDADSAVRETWHLHSRYAKAAAEAAAAVRANDSSAFVQILEREFPKNRANCKKPVLCPFRSFCYDTMPGPQEIPNGFEARVPHHDRERIAIYGA